MAKAYETHGAKPAAKAAPAAASKTKFKVGDKVKVGGEAGEVVEVCEHDEAYTASGQPQLYSVRLTPWVKTIIQDRNGTDVVTYLHPAGAKGPNGKVLWRDHEADTLGAIPEDAIQG